MDRVDREIAKVEQQILKLKKKQVSTAGTALVFCQWRRCGKSSFGDGEFFSYMNQMQNLKRKGYVYDFILNKLDIVQFQTFLKAGESHIGAAAVDGFIFETAVKQGHCDCNFSFRAVCWLRGGSSFFFRSLCKGRIPCMHLQNQSLYTSPWIICFPKGKRS